MDRAAIDAKLRSVSWFHAFEVLPGIVSPGHIRVDGRDHLDSLEIPRDLTGKTALDIGAWDGYVAFELARRGARTTAFDIQDPSRTGFNVARELMGFDVEYVQHDKGVYALPDALQGRTFDLVFFLAVFAGIKNPIEAFEGVASVMHEDSVLYFEGESLHCYAETLDGKAVRDPRLDALAASEVPFALCYPRHYKNAHNWWIPNVACLKSWLAAAGLEAFALHPIVNTAIDPPNQRTLGFARKVKQQKLDEHVLI